MRIIRKYSEEASNIIKQDANTIIPQMSGKAYIVSNDCVGSSSKATIKTVHEKII